MALWRTEQAEKGREGGTGMRIPAFRFMVCTFRRRPLQKGHFT